MEHGRNLQGYQWQSVLQCQEECRYWPLLCFPLPTSSAGALGACLVWGLSHDLGVPVIAGKMEGSESALDQEMTLGLVSRRTTKQVIEFLAICQRLTWWSTEAPGTGLLSEGWGGGAYIVQ